MRNPYSIGLDMQRQAWEGAAEMAEKAGVAPERAETLGDAEVGQTEHEVVYEENKLRLLHYEARTEEQHDVPILIVYALINKPYILDLQPDRSVVRRLLEAGFDVYMIDWGEPSKLDRSLTLEDYVTRYIDNCTDVVRERSDQESINVLGYCMGGTMAAMYAALYPEKVRNLGLMAAGLCFTGDGGVLELWGAEEYYEPETVTETFDNVPAEFLDVGFALMDPVANNVTKYVRFYDNMGDEEFVENFARMERWLDEGIDVAGATYEQFIADIYQENKLIDGELTLGDRHVDLSAIEMPVLQIVAEYDHLVPPGASKPFNEAIPSDDTEVLEFATGHIGMSVSSRSHAELWPDVCEWFEERSTVETDVDPDAPDPDAQEADAGLAEDVAGDETGPDDLEAGDDAGDEAGDGEIGEGVADDADGDGADAAENVDAAEDLPVTSIAGIGPAYAERLSEAGVTTVADLANADTTELAAETSISPSGLRKWIDRAADR